MEYELHVSDMQREYLAQAEKQRLIKALKEKPVMLFRVPGGETKLVRLEAAHQVS
jgi:hypothetical protein